MRLSFSRSVLMPRFKERVSRILLIPRTNNMIVLIVRGNPKIGRAVVKIPINKNSLILPFIGVYYTKSFTVEPRHRQTLRDTYQCAEYNTVHALYLYQNDILQRVLLFLWQQIFLYRQVAHRDQ